MRRLWVLLGAGTALLALGLVLLGNEYAKRDDLAASAGWTNYVPLSESGPQAPNWWYVGGGILVAAGLGAYAYAAGRFVAKRG